jgi:hypothetical protein
VQEIYGIAFAGHQIVKPDPAKLRDAAVDRDRRLMADTSVAAREPAKLPEGGPVTVRIGFSGLG